MGAAFDHKGLTGEEEQIVNALTPERYMELALDGPEMRLHIERTLERKRRRETAGTGENA